MKKLLVILFVIGITLGVAQMFYVREITVTNKTFLNRQDGEVGCMSLGPECGSCYPQDELVGDYCVSPPHQKKVRGFPLTVGAYGAYAASDISAAVIANTAIFTVGLPLTGYVVVRTKRALSKR